MDITQVSHKCQLSPSNSASRPFPCRSHAGMMCTVAGLTLTLLLCNSWIRPPSVLVTSPSSVMRQAGANGNGLRIRLPRGNCFADTSGDKSRWRLRAGRSKTTRTIEMERSSAPACNVESRSFRGLLFIYTLTNRMCFRNGRNIRCNAELLTGDFKR